MRDRLDELKVVNRQVIGADTVDQKAMAIDVDGDGNIDYKEFVDKLARDTVSIQAMGKRGMQSKQAMGVDAFAEIHSADTTILSNNRGGLTHYSQGVVSQDQHEASQWQSCARPASRIRFL